MFTELTNTIRNFDKNFTLNHIKTLVENGTDVKEDNNFAIRVASYYADFDTFIYLVEQGADIYANENEPFHNAMSNNLSIVRYLVCQGMNPHIPPEGFLGSYVGLAVENINILKYLVDELGVNHRLDNDAAFSWACRCGQLESAKFLYSKGVNINTTEGRPLLLACEFNQEHIVDFLISHEARLDINSQILINTVCTKGYLPLLKKLEGYGIKVENDNATMVSAVIGNSIPMVDYLIQSGISITADNGYLLEQADRTDDFTLLNFCIEKGLPESYIKQYASDKIRSYIFSHKLDNKLSAKKTTHNKIKI